MAQKEKEFTPSGVNPSWDDSEDKIWAVQDYLSMMGEFTDEDREFLRETDPELLSLEDDVDMMNESTRKHKMKFRKIVKESDEGDNNYTGDTPKIYVGTYAKYNDGSLDGKWVDLTEYSDYDEFLAAMHELHSDEDDPEFMVQDYENFPDASAIYGCGTNVELPVTRINYFYEDTPSSVEEIETAKAQDNVYYNLMGQKFDGSNMPAGIYIHNGKKVIIK